MSQLRESTSVLLDWAKYGRTFGAGDLSTPPVCFLASRGNGRAVKACLSDDHPDLISLSFERKLRPSDISEGKLLPVAVEAVKRRGGKRSLSFNIDCETAEALRGILKDALRDAKRRQQKRAARKRLSDFFLGFAVFVTRNAFRKAA